ncbi:MAG: FABP family protein [Acidimicrobiia bacterium]
MTDALHPAIRPLAFLLGTWKGAGRGDFPTAHPFEYGEEMRIGHAGKPFLFYEQRTWNPADGTPLHSEAGYFRISDDGTVEFVVAQPTGIAEVLVGPLNGTSFDLHSTGILLTPTAKETVAVGRDFTVTGDRLRYRLDLEAVGEAYVTHLEAELTRVP